MGPSGLPGAVKHDKVSPQRDYLDSVAVFASGPTLWSARAARHPYCLGPSAGRCAVTVSERRLFDQDLTMPLGSNENAR